MCRSIILGCVKQGPEKLKEAYLLEVRKHRGSHSKARVEFKGGKYFVCNAPGALGVKNGSKSKEELVNDIMNLRRRVVCKPATP